MKNADPKNPTTQKLFGTVVNEDDASHLVGGIVEKGFSEQPINGPTSWTFAPRPTVLPFPVPRHRSHGPHWAPKGGDVCGNNDHNDEENEEEEEDFTGINQIGNFAKPVQRKEKKGMDFCNWREIVASDNSSVPYKREERGRKVNSTSKERKAVAEASRNKNNSNERPPDENGNGASLSVEDGTKSQDVIMGDEHLVQEKEEDMAMDIEQGGWEQSNHSVLPQQKCGNGITEQEEQIIEDMHPTLQVNTQKRNILANKADASLDSKEVEGRHNASNLESQIDAENRAQLARMSADEIAEAQAELLAKLSPAVLEALKRKGQEKLKREKSYRSGSHLSGEKGSLLDQMKNETSQGTQKRNVEDDTPKLNATTNIWDEWSKRVESVRELRFSLDGDIVKSELEVPKSGVSIAQDLSERDYLRTEGDPGAAGYTIKEAVTLTRSAVAGQRTFALHLIASVLDRAICRIHQNQLGCILRSQERDGFNDWEAIWAFILGPEPELALSLRMSLDDNHRSVVLACARAIQCALSFEINEDFFEIMERIPTLQRDVPTAPVFRSRPEIEDGFLHGGFWKYNTKPSNILPFARDSLENDESERTIQDDVVVAGQDIAAGLIRMGILQRVQYLLETEPSAALEECLISILIAIARHSPTCADAIMKCQRLVQTIINRFTSKEQMEISISKIKSVALLRILARSDKENCLEFIKTGIFQKMIWQLYRYTSFDQWVKSGKEACKLSSALLVEQLRLWKVCVQHGYCVSYFADLFPALCIWLNVPASEKLIENSVLSEYAAIAKEAYLVLGALTRRLPIFYSHMQQLDRGTTKEAENWCWAHVGPMIDSALEWIRLKKIPLLSRLFEWQNEEKLNGDIRDSAVSPLLWLISSIMDMLSAVLEAVIPEDNAELHHGSLPWLPDFVPKIGLEILKNGLMSFSGLVSASHDSSAGKGSLLECLCYLRKINGQETSIASSSCLQGLLRVAWCVDKLLSLANNEPRDLFAKYQSFTREEKTLADGILHSSLPELRTLMTSLVESNGSKWRHMKSIETFGRGGPAPGIGVGWGAPGGGFWSKHILSAQVDARLFIYLLDVFPILSVKDQITTEGMNSIIQKINSLMGACLLLGPMDSSAVDKLLDFLFQVPTLKYIDFSIHQFLTLKLGYQSLERVYEEEDYLLLSDALASHFKKRWLSAKQKRKSAAGDEHVCRKNPKKESILLDTIPEENSASNPANQEPKCLVAEWAHQRLHLPLHWFLSPLSVLCSTSRKTRDFLKVAKGGLFFLLGIELMSTSLPAELCTPVRNVPIVWKLHALSAPLLSGMDIFEEENSRDLYKALQDVYGQLLDREEKVDAKKLKFKTDIHENYSTFIDILVEQFAAVSYGDMIFGRQVGVYLHHFVEAPVRLAAWNALSNACALELLPPLEKCIAATCGYLEPVEHDERMLEAYCKSWVSGALDKAASRGSASFTLALHHLSSFIFQTCSGNMLPLRNKLAKSLLRDYSCKKQHESLFVNLLEYQKPDTRSEMPQHSCDVVNRLQILKEACEGNSSLLSEVEKLSSVIRRKQHVGS